MRNAAKLSVLILGILVLACREHTSVSSGSKEANDTIAPAAAKPSPNGNDAMTQTVDVEDGRSESDGGLISNPPSAAKGAAPAASAKTATQPVRKKKP